MLFDGKFHWSCSSTKKLVQVVVQEALSCNVKTNKHFRLSWKLIQQKLSAVKFPSAHNILTFLFSCWKIIFLTGRKTQHDDMTFNG